MEEKAFLKEKIRYQYSRYMDIVKIYYYDKRERDNNFQFLRVNSIDVMRGILVIFSIFLLCQGIENNVNPIFKISDWNGFTYADMLLPMFIITMGMSIPFYVKKYYDDGFSLSRIIRKSLIRMAILFIIGILYSILFFDASKYVRLTGPIQLISINYIVVLLTYILFLKLRIKNNVLVYVFLVLGIIWSFIFTLIGVSSGNEAINSIFTVIDSKLIDDFKSSGIADPEGILAILSSFSLGYLGLSFGCIINKKAIEKKYIHYIRPQKVKNNGFSRENLLIDIKSWGNPNSIKAIYSNYYRLNNDMKKIVHLLVFFIFFISLMLISSLWIPYNRYIFSLSFVFRICAIFSVVELLLYILSDILRLRFGINFVQRLGCNAIMVVFIVGIVHKLVNFIKIKSLFTETWLPFSNWFTTDFILPVFGLEYSSAVYAVFITIIWLLVANVLGKYDIKINV